MFKFLVSDLILALIYVLCLAMGYLAKRSCRFWLLALSCMGLMCPPPGDAAVPLRYTVTDLGPLDHPDSVPPVAQAFAINGAGTVVGSTTTDTSFGAAFAFRRDLIRLLPFAPGFSAPSAALGINDRDWVVGYATTSRGVLGGATMRRPIMMKCRDARPIAECAGNISVLEIEGFEGSGTTLDYFGEASAVNAAGHIVGSQVKDVPATLRHWVRTNSTTMTAVRGFLFQFGKKPMDLGIFTGSIGSSSEALAINNHDFVVGSAEAVEDVFHAFVWQGGQMTDLGTLGGLMSKARGINNLNYVVGTSTPGYDLSFEQAFLAVPDVDGGTAWGHMRNLGALRRGRFQSAAYGINDEKRVVGWSETTVTILGHGPIRERHAMSYYADRMYDLNEFMDTSLNWILLEARAINNSGQIVGFGLLNGEIHGFRLEPVRRPLLPLFPTTTFIGTI